MLMGPDADRHCGGASVDIIWVGLVHVKLEFG